MKKNKTLFIVLGIIAVIFIGIIVIYNGLNTAEENINKKWSDVESSYQRRADLIPNLVNTVKGYATHEKTTLESVITARSQALQVKIDANNITPDKLAQYQKNQGDVTTALGKLLAISESYPDLKANQNFLELQAQLEGTENRINAARQKFNDATNQYNVKIRLFPTNIVARMFGFQRKYYFEATQEAEKAPEVKF